MEDDSAWVRLECQLYSAAAQSPSTWIWGIFDSMRQWGPAPHADELPFRADWLAARGFRDGARRHAGTENLSCTNTHLQLGLVCKVGKAGRCVHCARPHVCILQGPEPNLASKNSHRNWSGLCEIPRASNATPAGQFASEDAEESTAQSARSNSISEEDENRRLSWAGTDSCETVRHKAATRIQSHARAAMQRERLLRASVLASTDSRLINMLHLTGCTHEDQGDHIGYVCVPNTRSTSANDGLVSALRSFSMLS